MTSGPNKAFNIQAAAANLRRRFEKRRRERLALHEKALCDCAAIISMIIAEYKPKRIYQWGSLLRPENFGENSDIDIAVEGITDAETFFKLLGDAMRMTGFSLDILQIEKIEPEFAEKIRRHGKVVYEHP